MKTRQARIVAAAAFLALAGATWHARTHAGEVAPELRSIVAGAAPDAPVRVIATLTDRVDPVPYRVTDRRARDGRLAQALRNKAASTQGPLRAFLATQGAREVRELWILNAVAATVPASRIQAIAAFPGVDVVRADLLTTAPIASTGTAAPSEWNLDAVRAADLWSRGFTGAGIVVASLDTGVDRFHPDLASRWRGGANSWYDPHGQHAMPYDADGHGTQTMGVMVGGDAGGTSIGMAPGAQWIAAKIYDDAGYASYSDIHLAFQWTLDPDSSASTPDAPDVVLGSWGLVGTAGQCITEFDADIALLKSAGIAVAFAAGNDGPAPATSLSPANNPSAFSVGAVDVSLAVADFSARGPSSCTGAIFPNVVAPGVNVRTSDLSFGGFAFYATVSGTSLAAPHAAGAMALLMNAYPSANVDQLESALTQAARDLGATGGDNDYGSGLLDALTAFLLLGGAGSPPSFTSQPVTVATQDQPYLYTAIAKDPSGTAITYSLDVAPAGMTIDAASGVVRWTPTNAQVGANAVTVRATNANGDYGRQAYSIEVANVNDAPVAANDTATAPVRKGGAYAPVTINVVANDSDPDGNLDSASVTIASSPNKGGAATANGNGTVSYTPKAKFRGTETFTYFVRDAVGAASNVATVTVTVQ